MTWLKKLPWAALVLCALALTALFLLSNPEVSEAAGETRYIAVYEDSPDAILLKKPDRWADPIVQLEFNERVTLLSFDNDDKSMYSKIKVKTSSGTKIGYIKKNCIAKDSQVQSNDSKAQTATGAEAANTAAKGLNKQTEADLRANDPNFEKRLAEVEATETSVGNSVFGGNPRQPIKGRSAYIKFAKAGGLKLGDK